MKYQIQHGVGQRSQWETSPPPPQRNFRCIAYTSCGRQEFPVAGYHVRAATSMGLIVHFVHCHMWDTVTIVDEGNILQPQCPHCDMLVLWASQNVRQPNTSQCAKGADMKQCRLAVEEAWSGTDINLREYVHRLTHILAFKYLGGILTDTDNYCLVAMENLRKASNKWAQISRLLGWEGENTRT